MQLTNRRIERERMDDPSIEPSKLGAALDALERTNRMLLGTRSVIREFRRWSRTWSLDQARGGADADADAVEPIRVLDVGTGSADIPVALDDWARTNGWRVQITAVDLHPTTIAFARERIGERSSIEIIQADARTLTERFDPGAFHYAHAGLFLHHLHDLDVMTVLRIMDRLSTRGVLWNDLVRSPLTKLAIRPFSWFGPEVFRHDSIASMRAGFTRGEALELARRVGLANVNYRQILFHRFILRSETPAP